MTTPVVPSSPYSGPPSLERAEKLLASRRRSSRESGLHMLADLGRKELLLAHALRERVPGVVDVACAYLFPEPIELLKHALTMTKGMDAHLTMRWHIPDGNYLYAQEAIADLYRPRRSRLHPDVIEAVGLARLRAMCPFLIRYLAGPMVNIRVARETMAASAVAGIGVSVASDGSDTWSRPSACAVEAAVALRRADQPIAVEQAERMLSEACSAMDSSTFMARSTRARLEWVLFDTGARSGLDKLLALMQATPGAAEGDLLTTLLKRGDIRKAESISRDIPSVYLVWRGFCFWPVTDFLRHCGLLDVERYGRHPTMNLYGYMRARRLGIAAPEWWSWR